MGQDFIFIVCVKQIFLGETQLGAQKIFGGITSECHPWLRAWIGRQFLHLLFLPVYKAPTAFPDASSRQAGRDRSTVLHFF